MPYGIQKSIGGDSEENDGWMEKCVARVQETGKSKSSAIAICKAQLKKNKTKAEFILDEDIMNSFSNYREQWIRKSMNEGKTFNESSALFDSHLAVNNFIY